MEKVRGIPQIGDVLNKRYRLNAELGKGGFAIAFAGEDLLRHQAVAVKVLNKLTTEEDILQFSEEAYLMVGLEHSNIVPFIDYVPMKEGIRPYIVMKLAPRGSVQEELKERKKRNEWMPLRRSILLLSQAGEGLGYLHGRRIVHRDIKPDNFLLAGEEELWLSDFGIAKQVIGEKPAKTGKITGTPQYMAPEQLRGKPEAASDIYSLGVMAYYLFTGKLPFSGGVYEVIQKHLHEIPPNVLEVVQSRTSEGIHINVIKAVNPVVMQALAKEPDKRPVSVTHFTRTLVDEFDSASGEKPDKTVFTAVKVLRERWQVEQAATVIFDEDLKIKEVNALMQKAIAFYNQKHYEEALVAFDQVSQLDQTNYYASSSKGLTLYRLGRYEEAIAAYDQAIKIDPQISEAYNNKGVALNLLGRYEEAIAACDQAIKIDPQFSEAYNNKGNALDELGRWEEAVAVYNEAIRLQPQKSDAYYNKGITLARLGRNEEALVAFDQVIQLDPTNNLALNYKGNALNNLGRNEEALAAYDQAIRLDPQDSKAYYNKGNALGDLGRKEEALAAYDQAIRLNPQYSKAYDNKGIALGDLGRKEEALAAFDRAIQLDPNNTFAYNNKGSTLGDLGRKEEAIAAFDRVIQLDPNNSEAYYNKGVALNDLGRNEEAIAAFDRAIQLNPADSNAYNNKGFVLYTLKRYEEAIAAFDRAIQLNPNNSLAINNKRNALQEMKMKNKQGFFKRFFNN